MISSCRLLLREFVLCFLFVPTSVSLFKTREILPDRHKFAFRNSLTSHVNTFVAAVSWSRSSRHVIAIRDMIGWISFATEPIAHVTRRWQILACAMLIIKKLSNPLDNFSRLARPADELDRLHARRSTAETRRVADSLACNNNNLIIIICKAPYIRKYLRSEANKIRFNTYIFKIFIISYICT